MRSRAEETRARRSRVASSEDQNDACIQNATREPNENYINIMHTKIDLANKQSNNILNQFRGV